MLERVFIVDEDVRVRDFLYELISEVGYGALTVPTGREALERLKIERPHLVLIEDTPGEYTGISLVRKIREFDKDLKIVLLGPDPKPEQISDQWEDLRVTAYLKKEFGNPQFIQRILSVLKQENLMKASSGKRWGSVLIVDDEPESRVLTGEYLERRGFEVETAGSGEECLEKIRQRAFDTVLLDITMDGMDGLLTLKRIMDSNTKTKVIMVTALQDKEILAQALALGATDYLVKPFNLGTLESALLSIFLADKMGKARP